MSHARYPLTEEHAVKLRQEYRGEIGQAEAFAQQFDVPIWVIYDWVHRLDLAQPHAVRRAKTDPPPLYPEEEVRMGFGVSQETLECWLRLRSHPLRWTNETGRLLCPEEGPRYFSAFQLRTFITHHVLTLERYQSGIELLWFVDVLAGKQHGLNALYNPTEEEEEEEVQRVG